MYQEVTRLIRYFQIDLTGGHQLKDGFACRVIMTCMHTKLTKILSVSSRDIQSIQRVINILLAEWGERDAI